LPTPDAAETALRTQQIIAFESGISDVADPMAGSYYIESLTDDIIKKATKLINEIDEVGGAVKAIENNFQQNMISKSAYQYQMEIDKNERVVVGVNKFKSETVNAADIQKIDKKAINEQLNRLKIFKANRNQKTVNQSMKDLDQAISNNKNIMPNIIECVESNATLGEISDFLREKFGEHQN